MQHICRYSQTFTLFSCTSSNSALGWGPVQPPNQTCNLMVQHLLEGVPEEKGDVLVEGCDLWVKLEGPSHVLSNVTLDGWKSHWWRWCLCCVIDCHPCLWCMMRNDPAITNVQVLIYCNWWKITRPPNCWCQILKKGSNYMVTNHQGCQQVMFFKLS